MGHLKYAVLPSPLGYRHTTIVVAAGLPARGERPVLDRRTAIGESERICLRAMRASHQLVPTLRVGISQ